MAVVLLHCGTFPLTAPYARCSTRQGKGSRVWDRSGLVRKPRPGLEPGPRQSDTEAPGQARGG
ncbi:Hypothetical protein RAK1035_2474 [Roseovarius sp. AK1035]|nr:Hypothetical protein RAK1035_2474 [Roseovarius sp. AK1035]